MTNDNGKKKSVGPPPADIEFIDSAWDDDASGEIPIPGLEEAFADPYERVTAVPQESAEDYVKNAMDAAPPSLHRDQKSGVQPREDRPSLRPTPEHGLELDLPPLVTPDAPDVGPELDLSMDEPGRATYDDLSLELGSTTGVPDPMHLGVPPSADRLELDLELGTPAVPPVEDPALAQMRDRYAAGDFTGALVVAESMLETEPDNDEVMRYAQSCRDVLQQMYAARLGPLDQAVTVAVPPDQVRWLSLDHRAGFLLSLVDGTSSIEEILDISGMTRLDALRIMYTLLEQQIISLSGR
jgi:hypothetical protein